MTPQRVVHRVIRRAALVLLVVGSTPAAAGHAPARPGPAGPGSAFLLFDVANLLLDANRVRCNINDIGEWCVDPANSPVLGNGLWPAETQNQHLFNGGLWVAALVGADTVAAFFGPSTRADQSGVVIDALRDSRAGLSNWPGTAIIGDTSIFAPLLLGRPAASEQDSWVRYWDASPSTRGRAHPMGVLVEQRSLAWNYPVGNDDIVYQVYRLVNVTASDPARYAGLAAQGYSSEEIAGFVALGRSYRDRMRVDFGVIVPDSGHAFTQLHLGFYQDQDVANAGEDLATALVPFALGAAYHGRFSAPSWTYPADRFFTPFAAAPGFVAQAFLTLDGRPAALAQWNTLDDDWEPGSPGQLFRLLSGRQMPYASLPSCNVPSADVPVRHFCWAVQNPKDIRHALSVGPLEVRAGGATSLTSALIFAAAVDSALAPFAGGLVLPGLPLDGGRLAQGLDTVPAVARIMGWRSHADGDADGVVAADEVETVPRSLLWKAQLARALAGRGFITPQPPAAPRFLVVPGDGKVSVVWEASATESVGDPFFAAASDPATPLFDPSYREFDVEGYRVWRGTTAQNMQVVAEFDHTGTSITDHAGQVLYGSACAPELGVTTTCPALPNVVPLAGRPAQVRPGDRVLLANGLVSVLHADTLPMLYDTGVPFVFTDSGLSNAVSYYYAVTAFDANSVRSGPVSFESERVIKVVTPRVPASNPVTAESHVVELIGDEGTVLDPTAPFPAINANGTLAGPIPPANSGLLELLAHVPELLRPGDYVARVDSVGPGCSSFFCPAPVLFMSFVADTTFTATAELPQTDFQAAVDASRAVTLESRLVPVDTARARELGLGTMNGVYSGVRFTGRSVPMAATGAAVSVANARYGAQGTNRAARFLGHSYWYMEGGSPPANPSITPFPSPRHNSGALTGVDTIYHPAAYWQPTSGGPAEYSVNISYRVHDAAAAAAWYPGDFRVTWNANASLTVRDLTHHVDLPFSTTMTPGWGFINLDTLIAYGITADATTATSVADGTGTPSMNALSYHHAYAADAACQARGITCAPLSSRAVLQPLDFNADGTADGNGFVLVVNGEPFMMSLDAIPAVGTQWHLTAFGGGSLDAACDRGVPGTGDITLATAPTTCTYASYTPPPHRPAHAPGLAYRLRVTAARQFAREDAGSLAAVHTVPDPYYMTDALEARTGRQAVRFVNIPERAIIRIYSSSGILVAMVTHNDPTGGGEAFWDVRNRAGRPVASGVYFWHLVTADGRQKVGRFTVVNGRR